MEIIEVVRVRFLWPGKMYEFSNPNKLALKRGQQVVVKNDKGSSLVGTVMIAPRIRMSRKEDRDLNPVLRVADDQDLRFAEVNDEFRRDVKNFFETRLRARNLNGVKLIDIEKAEEGQKLIVYYSSEQKKFSARDFSVELGQKFKLRIDMRSVGVRDAARLSGGIGKCGLSLCCSTWIPDFAQISIRMAKDQGLSLDPESINGMCGRLLCCLGYEHENYVEMGKGLPKVGKKVITPVGEARVVKLDILKGLVTVKTEDGKYETFPGSEVERKFAAQQQGGDQKQQKQKKKPERTAKKAEATDTSDEKSTKPPPKSTLDSAPNPEKRPQEQKPSKTESTREAAGSNGDNPQGDGQKKKRRRRRKRGPKKDGAGTPSSGQGNKN